jgi:hypothetical protein
MQWETIEWILFMNYMSIGSGFTVEIKDRPIKINVEDN